MALLGKFDTSSLSDEDQGCQEITDPLINDEFTQWYCMTYDHLCELHDRLFYRGEERKGMRSLQIRMVDHILWMLTAPIADYYDITCPEIHIYIPADQSPYIVRSTNTAAPCMPSFSTEGKHTIGWSSDT